MLFGYGFLNTNGGGSGVTGTGTLNKYAKWTGATAIGNALLSDDGTNIIVPNGKFITGANTSLVQLSFGTSGNRFQVTTDGSNYISAGFDINPNTVSIYGGINSLSEFCSLSLNAARGWLEYSKSGVANVALVVCDAGQEPGTLINGGISIINNATNSVTSGTTSSSGVFINATGGTINSAVIGAVVFGTARTAIIDYTAYFTHINTNGNVTLNSLPTSSAGLPSGGVYNNLGILSIV